MVEANLSRLTDWFSLSDADQQFWTFHGRNVFQGRYAEPPPGWKPPVIVKGRGTPFVGTPLTHEEAMEMINRPPPPGWTPPNEATA